MTGSRCLRVDALEIGPALAPVVLLVHTLDGWYLTWRDPSGVPQTDPARLSRMNKPATYSIVVVPGQHSVNLILQRTVWWPHKGSMVQQLESVSCAWEEWQPNARRLVGKAIAQSADEVSHQPRLF